jgi:CBS domain-containing protein
MEISSAHIIDADEPLSKAISKILTGKVGVLVVKDGKYFGMVDERQLASAPKDASKAKVSKYAAKTPVLSPDSPIQEVVRAFFAGRFKTLPVIDGKKIIGTVSRWQVLSELSSSGLLSGYRVSQYMTTPVITIPSNETIGKAKAMMRDGNIRRLVVTENGRIEGIISSFDLVRLESGTSQHTPMMRQRGGDEKPPVSQFMRRSIETIGKDASLAEAISKMLETKVAALVVSDGPSPVGILTTKDILETLMRAEGKSKVSISGLHGFEEDAEDVQGACEAFVEKLGKYVKIEALNLHVKKTGQQYFVSAHIHGSHPLLSSASGWSLHEGVTSALDELSKQASKVKGIKLAEKKGN